MTQSGTEAMCWVPGADSAAGQWRPCNLLQPISFETPHAIVMLRQIDAVEPLVVPRSWVKPGISDLVQQSLHTYFEPAPVKKSASLPPQASSNVPNTDTSEADDILQRIREKRQQLLAQRSEEQQYEEAAHGSSTSTVPLPELRVDPVDGLRYSFDDFVIEYGEEEGQIRWDSAGAVLSTLRAAQEARKSQGNASSSDHDEVSEKNPGIAATVTSHNLPSVKSPGFPAKQNQKENKASKKPSTTKSSKSTKKLSKSQLRNKNSKLMKAAKGGRLESVVELLRQKAQVNYREPRHGYTALHQSAWHGFSDIVQHLLSQKARTDIRNHAGENALEAAQDGGHDNVVSILTQSINTENEQLSMPTPLDRTGSDTVVKDPVAELLSLTTPTEPDTQKMLRPSQPAQGSSSHPEQVVSNLGITNEAVAAPDSAGRSSALAEHDPIATLMRLTSAEDGLVTSPSSHSHQSPTSEASTSDIVSRDASEVTPAMNDNDNGDEIDAFIATTANAEQMYKAGTESNFLGDFFEDVRQISPSVEEFYSK